jgi:fructose-1,6-bisphosphatase I
MVSFQDYLKTQKTDQVLAEILLSLVRGVREVSLMLRGAEEGYSGTENVYGEKQLQLDVRCNELFVNMLQSRSDVGSIASEELEHELFGKAVGGGFSVAFDPLDGSSLADVNLAVGSIFGVYSGRGFVGRQGNEQVAALIAVYGPRLTFMVSIGKGVCEFLYDEKVQDFVLNHENIQLADEKKMFAPGNLRAGVSERWYVELLEYWVMNGYTLRYSGGMVPDVNQILKKGGGVFTYPGYREQPNGKLRLLYECAPMAYLIEQAGGSAVGLNGRILDISIEKLDQRTPIFLGSKKEIEAVEARIKNVK